VFLDYGEGWETAWQNHVANWKLGEVMEAESTFLSVKELNDVPGPLPLLVSGDLRKSVQSPAIFTVCAYWITDDDYDESYEEEDPEWEEEPSDEELFRVFSTNGDFFQVDYQNHADGTYWPCSVALQEDEEGTRYTVRINQSPFAEHMPWDMNDVPRFLTHYPRSSIRYFRRPYASDQHMSHAFRHYIEIPDEIFPEHWKNRRA